MAKYSRRRYKRDESESKSLSLQRRVLNTILFVLTLISGVALLLTLIAPYIKPMEVGLLPMLALVAPAIYLANVALMLYWLSIWRWREALMLLLLLLLGSPRISLFLRVPLTKQYGEQSYRGASKILSYNVRHLIADGGEDCTTDVAHFIESERPDIIALQELGGAGRSALKRSMSKLKSYNWVSSNSNDGVAIASRYPIVDSGDHLGKAGRSIWADIVIGRDTIRLFNNHLQSTSITKKDDRYLTSTMVVRDTNRTGTLRSIVGRYHESCIIRANQVEIISRNIANSPHRVVVCGDFNDTPTSYAYNTLSRDLNDTFQLCGEGYSYTFRGFMNMLRIDYILTSRGISPLSYKVDREIVYSDHLPVMSHIKIE